jgi:eukaryotic-like serine/threonine-protein kinase
VIGRKLAHYEIVDQLGEGGMGVVYKARDTQLDRFVAIKVLHADATIDLERRRRFVQEAKAASALNHPGIVTIYGISSDAGLDFIAMEYVAGQTLEQLIRASVLSPAVALEYAIQAARALARAHAAGIVHRDIKPSNIMVTAEGLVKVLDFGVAKLVATADRVADESSVTQTGLHAAPRTEEGRIVGTAAYMSPEQAAGQPVDARSDIFSLGTVLYEMVTGVRAFGGTSSVSTLAAVLTAEPKPPSELSRHLPRDFERVILRCLRKDAAKRFQVVTDIVVELEEIATASGDVAAMRRPSRRAILVASAALAIGLAAGAAAILMRGADDLPAPTVGNLTSFPGDERYPSLSPDGNQVAFSWTGVSDDNYDIYIKTLGADTPLRLTTSAAEDGVPAWSPDGTRIAFVRREGGASAVYLTPPVPGSERKLVEFRPSAANIGRMNVSWTPDAQWLAIGTSEAIGPALSLLPVTGGQPRTLLTNSDADGEYYFPAISKRGEQLAYAVCRDIYTCDVWVVGLDASFNVSGRPRRLTNNAVMLQGLAWAPDERSIVYGAIFGGGSHLWRVGVSGGRSERLELAAVAEFPAVSPAANRLVFSRSAGDVDVWKFDGGAPVSVLSSTATDFDPQLSPDGLRAAFVTWRSGRGPEIWVATLDGTRTIPLTQPTGRSQGSPRWSPDGRWLAYDAQGEDGNWDIYVIDAAGGPSRRLTTHPSFEHFASFSRDGQWIYFRSARTGRSEVWRVPASGGTEQQVTTSGGAGAWESWDGQTLYYSRHDGNGPEGQTSGVFARAVGGGPERKVLDSVFRWDFFPVADGIYYIALIEPRRFNVLELRFLSFATSKSTVLSRFQARGSQGLSASADGKTILYSGRAPGAGTDLVMIQNFR